MATWCRICGRLLTVPESVTRGIGPVCAERIMCEQAQENLPKDQILTGYTQGGDIVMSRDKNGNKTINISRHVVKHSPTGVEWGYAGSGPADLALSIMCEFLPVDEALQVYQQFKDEFIAGVPAGGGRIEHSGVQGFLTRCKRYNIEQNQTELGL